MRELKGQRRLAWQRAVGSEHGFRQDVCVCVCSLPFRSSLARVKTTRPPIATIKSVALQKGSGEKNEITNKEPFEV